MMFETQKRQNGNKTEKVREFNFAPKLVPHGDGDSSAEFHSPPKPPHKITNLLPTQYSAFQAPIPRKMEAEYFIYAPDHFLEIGLELVGAEQQKSYFRELSLFKQHYRLHPETCCELWELLVILTDMDPLTQPEHLLWTLNFMKSYDKLEALCNRFDCCEDTFRKYTKHVIHCIASLEFIKIKWENRFLEDDGSPAKVTVDGTDFRTVEYLPFTKDRYSHKFNGPGLRYEIAISIKTGYIVHINGPFLPGAWPDLKIARAQLHQMMPEGEYYLADSGYRARNAPSITRNEVAQFERRRMGVLLARHETINRRFKMWEILNQTFRHDEELHGPVFTAIAVMTQLEIESGCFVFDCEDQ